MVRYFIGVYIINRTLHGRLEIRNFSSRVKKYFLLQHSKRKISVVSDMNYRKLHFEKLKLSHEYFNGLLHLHFSKFLKLKIILKK